MRPIDTCILFSTADWDAPYWTNKQHTAKNLALKGIQVLYIESFGLRRFKISSKVDVSRLLRRFFRGFRGIRAVDKNIYVLSPLVIPFKHNWFLIRWLNQTFLRASINIFTRIMQSKGGASNLIVWSYHPYAIDSIPRNQSWPIVYHCVDDLSEVPGIDGKSFNLVEREFLKKVDIVFTTTSALFKKCKPFSKRIYNFPNVVDFEHFSIASNVACEMYDLAPIPKPRIAYVGVLSDFKIDFELLYEVVKLSPQWQFVFIGEEREGQSNSLVFKLKLESNVHFLGYKKYADLPMYMSDIDVAILPTLINAYTKAMFPMKYFEYISAGLPVVSTPLDFLQEHAIGVLIGYDARTFVNAIAKQLNSGKISRQQSASIVGDNTWVSRLDKMIDCIKSIEVR